jgi:hypothetical protein
VNLKLRTIKIIEKVWRLSNAVVFAVAFLGPWGPVFGDVVHGGPWVGFAFATVTELVRGDSVPKAWADWALYYSFGWIWIGVYWPIGFARTFSKNRIWKKLWLDIPLGIGTLFLLSDLLPRLSYGPRLWWFEVYWGYWLLLLSMGSSILLEIVSHLVDRVETTKPV